MKKTFLVIIACVLILGIGTSAKAETWQDAFRQLPSAQRQGIDQVANKFGGDINGLRALYVVGREKSHQVILPAGHSLLWTAWQDGWVSCVFRTDKPLSGKQVLARLNGKPIAMFYPDDKSFLFCVFAVPDLDETIKWREAPIQMTPTKQAYRFLDEEIYVPPTH